MESFRVSVLGSTGILGQRFLSLISKLPNFELSHISSSDSKYGKRLSNSVKWIIDDDYPEEYGDFKIDNTHDIGTISRESDIVFSALPTDASSVEIEFAKKIPVISKSSLNRMLPDVPLFVPGVSHDQLEILHYQRRNNNYSGFITCDANCSSTQLSIAIKPLIDLSIDDIVVDTMQAISGSGYPGLSSMDIADNVIPYIEKEDEKIITETPKIMGKHRSGTITPMNLNITAMCNRVNVTDGHMETVFMKLNDPPELDEIVKRMSSQRNLIIDTKIPLFPEKLLMVNLNKGRPQPRLDRRLNGGMSVIAGGFKLSGNWLSFTTLSHNTILGGAGSALVQAGILISRGII